jgi:hypothetical protein
MAITWMRTSDAFRDLNRSDKDFTAFDGKTIIGRVYELEQDREKGLWSWSMSADLPGPTFTNRSGREARRGDAGRRVVEAYHLFLQTRRDA